MTESSTRVAARVRRIVHVARNQSKASRASLAWRLELELDSTEEMRAVFRGRKQLFRFYGGRGHRTDVRRTSRLRLRGASRFAPVGGDNTAGWPGPSGVVTFLFVVRRRRTECCSPAQIAQAPARHKPDEPACPDVTGHHPFATFLPHDRSSNRPSNRPVQRRRRLRSVGQHGCADANAACAARWRHGRCARGRRRTLAGNAGSRGPYL